LGCDKISEYCTGKRDAFYEFPFRTRGMVAGPGLDPGFMLIFFDNLRAGAQAFFVAAVGKTILRLTKNIS